MKTKFSISLLVMLFITTITEGQILGPPKEVNVPKSYWKQLDKQEKQQVKETAKKQRKSNKGEADFYLTEVPVPNIQNMIQGEYNWSRAFHEIPENEAKFVFKGNVDIAIIDTGEPDNRYVTKYKNPKKESVNFVGGSVVDGHFHATHVAGSIVANVNGKLIGIARAAAEDRRLTQTYYKACNDNGGCFFNAIESAIRDYTKFYLEELKPIGTAGVINMSLGGSSIPSSLEDAMREAVEAGIAIFAAAGNNGLNRVSCPGCSQYTYAIGAADSKGQKANFSNFGKEIVFIGAGVNVPSTCLGDGAICNASGTSMSTPQVAGVYCLLKAQKPAWTATETILFMAEHATDGGDPGWDEQYGHGFPKMGEYMKYLNDGPTEPTCNDGLKNGDEEGIDCGGSCPPCDNTPPPDEGVVFPERIVPVSISGEWPALWVEAKSQSIFTYSLDGKMDAMDHNGTSVLIFENPQVSANKYGWITITDVTFRTKTTEDAAITAHELKTHMNNEWSGNRGVGISAPADFHSGGQWAGYFTDLLFDRSHGLDITIASFRFRNEKGQYITLTEKDIQPWPRGSKPFSYDFYIDKGDDDLVVYKEHPDKGTPPDKKVKEYVVVATWYAPNEGTTGGAGLPDGKAYINDKLGPQVTSFKSTHWPTKAQIENHPPYGLPYSLDKVIKVQLKK